MFSHEFPPPNHLTKTAQNQTKTHALWFQSPCIKIYMLGFRAWGVGFRFSSQGSLNLHVFHITLAALIWGLGSQGKLFGLSFEAQACNAKQKQTQTKHKQNQNKPKANPNQTKATQNQTDPRHPPDRHPPDRHPDTPQTPSRQTAFLNPGDNHYDVSFSAYAHTS